MTLKLGITATSLVLLLLASACGANDDTQSSGAPEQNDTETESPSPDEQEEDDTDAEDDDTDEKQATKQAEVIDTAFLPKELTITAGSTVMWKQTGRQAHSVSSSDGDFDSSSDCSALEPEGCLGEGDSFSHDFDEPGTYDYFCRIHGLPDGTGMTGTVTVKG